MITLIDIKQAPDLAEPLLWRLLEERPPGANISHAKMPGRLDHKTHVAYHPHKQWCLVRNDADVDVGAVYLTMQYEIGIGILREHQRKGYARAAIEAMMQRHGPGPYLANVAPGNHISRQLFGSLNQSKLIQVTYRFTRGEDDDGTATESGTNT